MDSVWGYIWFGHSTAVLRSCPYLCVPSGAVCLLYHRRGACHRVTHSPLSEHKHCSSCSVCREDQRMEVFMWSVFEACVYTVRLNCADAVGHKSSAIREHTQWKGPATSVDQREGQREPSGSEGLPASPGRPRLCGTWWIPRAPLSFAHTIARKLTKGVILCNVES